LASGGDTAEDGAATGVQPLPRLPFPSLSAALRWVQEPETAGFGREGWRGREEQCLPGLKGRATQPQPTYIRQPEVRVLHHHLQHVPCLLPVKEAGVSHRLNDHQHDVCPLSRSQVWYKSLGEEGGERGQVTPSATALARDARLCWLLGRVCWSCSEPGLAGGQEGWSCCWDTECSPGTVPAQGEQEPSHQGQRGHVSPIHSGRLCSHECPADAMEKSPSKRGAPHRVYDGSCTL